MIIIRRRTSPIIEPRRSRQMMGRTARDGQSVAEVSVLRNRQPAVRHNLSFPFSQAALAQNPSCLCVFLPLDLPQQTGIQD